VFYAGLCASGILVLVGLLFALGSLTESLAGVPGDLATKVVVAGLTVTTMVSWRRLAGLLG
jgi:hypothetical protein